MLDINSSNMDIYAAIAEDLRNPQRSRQTTIFEQIATTINGAGGKFDWENPQTLQSCFVITGDADGSPLRETPLTEVLADLRGVDNERTRQQIVDGLYSLVRDGRLFFQKAGSEKPYSVGLSQDSDETFTAYAPGEHRRMDPPERPSALKRFFHRFGFFSDAFRQYDIKVKLFNDYERNQAAFDQHNTAEAAGRRYRAEAERQRAEARQREESQERKAELSEKFNEKFKFAEKIIESRCAEGRDIQKIPPEKQTMEQRQLLDALDGTSISDGYQKNLETLVNSDPVNIARVSRIKEIINSEQYNEKSELSTFFIAEKYFGSSRELAGAIPTEGVETRAETRRFLSALTRVAGIMSFRNDHGVTSEMPSPEDVAYLKDVCRKNLGILNKNLEKAGITDDFKIDGQAPDNVADMAVTAVQGRDRAEVTSQIARRLADLYPRNSKEFLSLMSMSLRAGSIAGLGEKFTELEGSQDHLSSLSESIRREHARAKERLIPDPLEIPEEEEQNFQKELTESAAIRPEPPYQTLQKNAGTLSAEEGRRLAAELVVSSMQKDALPKGVYPCDLAEQLAAREDFKTLTGNNVPKMAEMVRSGELIKSTGRLFAPAAEPLAPDARPQMEQTLQMSPPSSMGR